MHLFRSLLCLYIFFKTIFLLTIQNYWNLKWLIKLWGRKFSQNRFRPKRFLKVTKCHNLYKTLKIYNLNNIQIDNIYFLYQFVLLYLFASFSFFPFYFSFPLFFSPSYFLSFSLTPTFSIFYSLLSLYLFVIPSLSNFISHSLSFHTIFLNLVRSDCMPVQ